MTRNRVAWLYPSTGLLDGYLHGLARERDIDLFIFRVVADPNAELDVESLGELDRLTAVAEAAAGIRPDAIAWACTAGSYISGPDHERRQREKISAAAGCPATTTSTAILWALNRQRATRAVVLSPYTQPIGEAFCRHLERQGLRVVAQSHAGHGTDEAISGMTVGEIMSLLPRVALTKEDVIVIPCTALRSEVAVPELEKVTRAKVVTANLATLEHALHLKTEVGDGIQQGADE